jgi:hypothetical protein
VLSAPATQRAAEVVVAAFRVAGVLK